MDAKYKKMASTAKTYKFRDRWLELEEFKGWLEKSDKKRGKFELVNCKICDCTLNAHKSSLLKHRNTKRHKEKEVELASSSHIETPSHIEFEVKRAELKLCGFLAEHNLPFQVQDCLVPLCKDIFSDSAIASSVALRRTKSSKIIKKSIGNHFLESIYKKLRDPGNFFSIILDETTDQSSIKQGGLTVIYMDEQYGIRYNFFDLFEVKCGTAEQLYKDLKHSILSKGIPLENLVGFSSDTTNVMVGEFNSVFTHLKEDSPHIVCIKCSCHMIHLAASKACLKLPRNVEDLLRNIGSHFSRSYGRQLAFQEFQEFFRVDIHKILSPSTTRWLSLKECVDRILEQYIALEYYLRDTARDDPSKTLQNMVDTMNNVFTKAYLEFMSYVLGILCDFNKMFQSEQPLLHQVKPEVEKLLKDICSNFIIMQHVKGTTPFNIKYTDQTYYVPMDKIYIGTAASETMDDIKKMPNIKETDLENFYNTIISFYVELVRVVKLKFNFNDEIYNIITIVDPQTAQDYETKTLSSLGKRFPILKQLINFQDLDTEYKRHALLDHAKQGLHPTLPAAIYWQKVFQLKTVLGAQAFPNLCLAMKLLLVLPFSNASVERIFSTLKNCKTAHRNRMKTDTLKGLIAAKEGIKNQHGCCVKFEPTEFMMKAKLWD